MQPTFLSSISTQSSKTRPRLDYYISKREDETETRKAFEPWLKCLFDRSELLQVGSTKMLCALDHDEQVHLEASLRYQRELNAAVSANSQRI